MDRRHKYSIPHLHSDGERSSSRRAESGQVACAEQSVEQNVIGLEGGIGFQFAAPIALLVLLREKKLAGIIDAPETRLNKPSILPKRS
jgi:hypothetical protein